MELLDWLDSSSRQNDDTGCILRFLVGGFSPFMGWTGRDFTAESVIGVVSYEMALQHK
jgi:hypothetical protein